MPILALILTRTPGPMAAGLIPRCSRLAGSATVPRANPWRITSGATFSLAAACYMAGVSPLMLLPAASWEYCILTVGKMEDWGEDQRTIFARIPSSHRGTPKMHAASIGRIVRNSLNSANRSL